MATLTHLAAFYSLLGSRSQKNPVRLCCNSTCCETRKKRPLVVLSMGPFHFRLPIFVKLFWYHYSNKHCFSRMLWDI